MTMRMNKVMRGAVLGVGLMTGLAHAAYRNETFEGYLVGTNLAELVTEGWGASQVGVIVTNNLGTNTTRLVTMPAEKAAVNAVGQDGTGLRIWTEFQLSEGYGLDCLTLSTNLISGAAAAVALFTNGCLVVYNPAVSAWVLCTNDVVGSNVAGVAMGSWPKVSICTDYVRHQAAVFMNGRLVAEGVPFLTNRNDYSTFTYTAGSGSNSCLDNLWISNAVPATLTSDSDDDGRADAVEIDQFGSIAVTGRLAIAASVTNAAGGTVTPSGSVTGIRYNGATNFAFASSSGYVLDKVWTNDVLAVSYNHQVKTGSFAWSNVMDAGTLKVGYYYDGKRYVPGDYGTIAAAIAASQVGDQIIVSNGAYAETLVLSNGVTLVGTNLTGTATNLQVTGGLTVAAGTTGTVQGVGGFTVSGTVSVAAGSLLVVSNATVMSFNSLTIGSGGSLQITGGTLTADGITLSGPVTLDSQWGTVIRASTLNFSDSFESYVTNKSLQELGWYGWGASSNSAVVQAAVVASGAGSKALLVPESVLVTNVVSAPGPSERKVWTDLWWREAVLSDAAPELGDGAMQAYVGTNGWFTLYNNGAWDVCSNDFWGMANTLTAWQTDAWHRVTVFLDFGATNAAFFVDGRLLRAGVPFVNPGITSYSRFEYSAGGGNAYLDAVKIWTNPPALLDGDLDGIDDGVEVHLYGNPALWPHGSIFKIR